MEAVVFDQIRTVFGRYKAEWLRGDVFRLFQKPGYFPELEEPRPTALVGGRGTGKTSVLRSLSYQGHFELHNRSVDAAIGSPYAGLYWCIDSNRVTAFSGPELNSRQWLRYFAHYVNLEVVGRLLEYATWWEATIGDRVNVSSHMLNRVATSLHLGPSADVRELAERVDEALIRLEATVNAIADYPQTALSAQGAPIEYAAEALAGTALLRNKLFYVIVDEFENLNGDQQSLFNTLIKHGRERVVFKIGVKEQGWRNRVTMNGQELGHPADYDLIDLSERFGNGQYQAFAREVCDARLAHAFATAGAPELITDVAERLEELSPEQEAALLGIDRKVALIRADLGETSRLSRLADHLDDLALYYLQRKAEADELPLHSVIEAYAEQPQQYLASYRENYRQALLFTISEHSGRGIQKYYAGWQTLSKVSGGNIRYLMELLERSFALHREAGGSVTDRVGARHQTEACIAVGRKYAQEVQSLDAQGNKLAFLLLGLGRLFGLLARKSVGRQPDTTSFVVTRSGSAEVDTELDELLRIAVMHQVLRSWPATKLTSQEDSKETEYSVHPIFAAFFVFPYQKKRRIRIKAEDLVLMSKDLRGGLRKLLRQLDVEEDNAEIPSQLSLFQQAYAG